MSPKIQSLLQDLDTCAVSDALDALGLDAGVSGISRVAGAKRIAGRAVTVTIEAGTPPPDRPKVHLGASAVDRAGDGDVIVIAHPGIDAGGWGGVLSNAASLRGIEGVVLDGPARDVDEADALGFSVFSRGSTPRTARGRVFESASGEPISIGGVRVEEGDYVLADGTGVVFIPQGRADEVIAKARHIAAREALMVDALKSGQSTSAVLGADYEDMLKS